jgi:hypothetical protein
MIAARDLRWLLPAGLGIGALLALTGPGTWWIGWLAFSTVLVLGLLALLAAWRWAGAGRTLAWIVVTALILRLGLAVGLYLLLPAAGYPTETQRAGYVFYDAFRRDAQAWQLASSNLSLWKAFDGKAFVTDQYGGMLFLSAATYRLLSPDAQRPLLIAILAALVSVLAIPFLWKAASHRWGGGIALSSAWILALYPEALLQSSSQMREPFLITFSALALWGFVDWQARQERRAWWWVAGGLAGMLLFSPGIAIVTLVILGGWFWFGQERRLPWWAYLVAIGVFLAGVLVLTWSWGGAVSISKFSPVEVISTWARQVAKWNLYVTRQSSGMIQFVFQIIPASLRLPFVGLYGILQPVLPAAVFDFTVPLWRVLGLLRAVGWYVFLPLLMAGWVAAWRAEDRQDCRIWLWLSSLVWVWVLIASVRGGGDQWDNPRYRVILLVWQALLAGYAWQYFRSHADRWLGRIIAMEIAALVIFSNWYATRYYHVGLPMGISTAILLTATFVILIPLADWMWMLCRARKSSLTQPHEHL